MSARTDILLVEDDHDELAVQLRALRRADLGASVEIARDGLEALEALGLESVADAPLAPPRVVFLDLKMPRIDGWEVLRRMRGDPRTSEVPVVVVSSSDRPEDIERSYSLGANSFVLKRFDPGGPGGYIEAAARYWLELNCAP